jgi:hypothetical protein
MQMLLVADLLRAAADLGADGASPVDCRSIWLPFEARRPPQVALHAVFTEHLIAYWIQTCENCTSFWSVLTKVTVLVLFNAVHGIVVSPRRNALYRHVHLTSPPRPAPVHGMRRQHAVERKHLLH